MKRIVVIGAGITGLAAAHRLVELARVREVPLEVLLLEASSRVGGIIKTEIQRTESDDFLLERGPDSFISEKPEAINLAERLGLTSQLIQTNKDHRRSFIVRDGRLRPVPEGFQLMAPSSLWPFITSDVFSWAGKVRMALDLVLPRKALKRSTDESLASFVTRRLGKEALERMAQPMVGGIYSADPEKLSLRATLPRFLEMESTDRSLILGLWRRARHQNGAQRQSTSGARYSLFLSFANGMQTLVDQLGASLPAGAIHLNTRVSSLAYDGLSSLWTTTLDSGQPISSDALCLALPSYIAASLLRDASPTISRELEEIEYESTATVNLAYHRADIKHPLDGFGFVVPYVENRSIMACTFSTLR